MNRQCCKISIEEKKDLFSYTSGRYVYNEKKRLAERYIEFDIEALKLIAAESVGRQKVSHMKKLAEGGFNRVFLLTLDDGLEVIVKIPYPLTAPRHFTTESEVATPDFCNRRVSPCHAFMPGHLKATMPSVRNTSLWRKLPGSFLTTGGSL
jgi:hypothetical protein